MVLLSRNYGKFFLISENMIKVGADYSFLKENKFL